MKYEPVFNMPVEFNIPIVQAVINQVHCIDTYITGQEAIKRYKGFT